MMEIFGYGEDSLTLWALKERLEDVLKQLGDASQTSECKIFYRPSFGRRGGKESSQFGEFDFILLSKDKLYLGESKWDGSSELKNGHIELRDEQKLRHVIFKYYVECWFSSDFVDWDEFTAKIKMVFERESIQKPPAPSNSVLSSNLQTILGIIKQHYHKLPDIQNVLMYLYKTDEIPLINADKDFGLVLVDYSKATVDNLIKM